MVFAVVGTHSHKLKTPTYSACAAVGLPSQLPKRKPAYCNYFKILSASNTKSITIIKEHDNNTLRRLAGKHNRGSRNSKAFKFIAEKALPSLVLTLSTKKLQPTQHTPLLCFPASSRSVSQLTATISKCSQYQMQKV